MSARDALPTGLALGGRHLPDDVTGRTRYRLVALLTVAAAYHLVARR